MSDAAAHADPPHPPATPAEAVAALLAALQPLDAERLPLAQSPGRVLAEVIRADRPSPAMDYSAMDGYALRAADAAMDALTPFSIAGEVRIGREPPALPDRPRAALRIVTGAPIPPGADAVVMIERTRPSGDAAFTLDPGHVPLIRPGLNIRRAGENAAAGDALLDPGAVITGPAAGVLAAVGCASVPVVRAVRVAIFSTGDELVDPAAAAAPTRWQVRDSNSLALAALFAARPWLLAQPRGRLPDDHARIARALADALAHADALILTGGVSMGHRDHVPAVLADLGARSLFHRLPQRPGRPVLAAILPAAHARPPRPILALPGNPVSVLVTARRLALPALARLAGLARPDPTPPSVRLVNPDRKTIDLWWHRLVALDHDALDRDSTGPTARLLDPRGSGDLIAAGRSDGFIEVPPGQSGDGPWPIFMW